MNIQGLMKQAQQMQGNIKKIEKELETTVYAGTSGGGAVKVEINGAYEVVSLNVQEELLEKNSKEILEEMLVLAMNTALKTAKKDREEKLGEITQGIKMPGVF